MKSVTILGGSSAGVGTGQGCSSYLVTIDDTHIVLDMGPDTLQELRKHVDFRKLDAIIISHLHMDHILDLFALRFTLTYNPIKAERKTPLYLPPGGLAFFAQAAALFTTKNDNVQSYFSDVYELAEYDPTREVIVGTTRITFAPTVHVVPCWAIRMHPADGDDFVYTADAGTDSDLDAFVDGAALVVADSAAAPDASEATKRGVHFDAAAAAELANHAGATHLVLTHQWEENDPDRNAVIAARHFDGEIDTAKPGLEVTW
ncbi:MAG: MBL fold metallo-hydrolase [Thermomicrobiales bacterium]|nr:MBL fold metallo-hydrolase [Thermomicrobiales bacterium]